MVISPGEFAGEDEFHGGYWAIEPIYRIPTGDPEHPDLWRFNPRLAVTDADREMVLLWLSCGGPEPWALPQAGGALDQAALMMDAFAVIAAGSHVWRQELRGEE